MRVFVCPTAAMSSPVFLRGLYRRAFVNFLPKRSLLHRILSAVSLLPSWLIAHPKHSWPPDKRESTGVVFSLTKLMLFVTSLCVCNFRYTLAKLVVIFCYHPWWDNPMTDGNWTLSELPQQQITSFFPLMFGKFNLLKQYFISWCERACARAPETHARLCVCAEKTQDRAK